MKFFPVLVLFTTAVLSLVPVSPEEKATLKDYARFSSISSCLAPRILGWDCGTLCSELPDVEALMYFKTDKTDGVGYIARRGTDELLVVFRASSTLLNWIYNLEVLQEQVPWNVEIDPAIMVHSGFYRTYMSIAESVRLGVQTYLEDGMRVTFVGHSLGGALATLALCDLVQQGIVTVPRSRLVTFGSPRVGNAAWTLYFQTRFSPISTRVVNKRDVVPHLPPLNPVIPYFQVTREWWFEAKARGWKCSAENPEDPQCSNQYSLYLVDDHFYFEDVIFGCAPQELPFQNAIVEDARRQRQAKL